MEKIIEIGGKNYKFEYTLKASLCEDFVEKITEYTMDFSTLVAKYNVQGELLKSKNQALDLSIDAVKELMKTQTKTVPKLTILGFYAGLLEHHNLTKEQAYDLYVLYMKESNKKPTEILAEIMEKVNEDNFFEMIGLDLTKMMKSNKANKSTTKKQKATSKKK